jgi:hypothetical protein
MYAINDEFVGRLVQYFCTAMHILTPVSSYAVLQGVGEQARHAAEDAKNRVQGS